MTTTLSRETILQELERNAVDWRKIAGLRDVVIHESAAIDLGIVWNVVESKTPELKARMRSLEDPGSGS